MAPGAEGLPLAVPQEKPAVMILPQPLFTLHVLTKVENLYCPAGSDTKTGAVPPKNPPGMVLQLANASNDTCCNDIQKQWGGIGVGVSVGAACAHDPHSRHAIMREVKTHPWDGPYGSFQQLLIARLWYKFVLWPNSHGPKVPESHECRPRGPRDESRKNA